jgi:HD-GYP domain-containing protein (c-di-GMP phosphodiesterase class II)
MNSDFIMEKSIMESQNNTYDTIYRYTTALSAALGYRDLMTGLHSERVCGLSMALGVAYGLDKQDLSALRLSSAFHDVGKIGVPDAILMKPGKHDEAEWEVMKRHSEIGEKIMLATEMDGASRAAIVIRTHHEHYDGHGYPDGLSGKHIPICARIISIADSYDAMAVTRSYHKARKHHEILKILHDETGAKHDPELMALFFNIIEESEFKTDNK